MALSRFVVLLAAVMPTAALAAPAVTPHAITCGDPKTIGTAIPTLETKVTDNHAHWNVAAATRACVIIGWTDSELVASWDDGVTFERFAAGAKVQSAAVGETGTIYVIRLDDTLDVVRTDGTIIHRKVAAADAALAVRGRWLWLAHRVVGDNTQLLSDDDGATWHKLEWTDGKHSDLIDLVILDDGTVVGRSQLTDCDHFGCGGRPLRATSETTLAGGTWRAATRAHARMVPADPTSDGTARSSLLATASIDRHGMKITRDLDSRYIVRAIGTTFRAIYTTRPAITDPH